MLFGSGALLRESDAKGDDDDDDEEGAIARLWRASTMEPRLSPWQSFLADVDTTLAARRIRTSTSDKYRFIVAGLTR
jgi:hypothetical protein